ncbi:hypothetical protein F4679DRAFT_179876 [Xylaria curta]|nr:hypothetical protein F4679DRAFT_179876 [Xylaria curta]
MMGMRRILVRHTHKHSLSPSLCHSDTPNMSAIATATTSTGALRRRNLSSSSSSPSRSLSSSRFDHSPVEEMSKNPELDQINHLVNWNRMFTMDGYNMRRPVEMNQADDSEEQHPESSSTHRAPSNEEEQHPALSPIRHDPYEVAEGPQKRSSPLSLHSSSVPGDSCPKDADITKLRDIQQPAKTSSPSTRGATHRISKPRQRQIQTRSANQKPRRGRVHGNHANFLELDERGIARRTSR